MPFYITRGAKQRKEKKKKNFKSKNEKWRDYDKTLSKGKKQP
jgi:hypothetical protein